MISRDDKLDFEGRFGVGTPIGSLGHNRFVAFSGTHNKPDYADAYIVTLDPNTSGAYLLDGQSKPFTIWQETFQVAGAPDTTFTFRSSRDHGIMFKNLGDGKVLMAKMEVMDSSPAGLQNYRKMTARSIKDFQAAMQLHQSFKGNLAAIDVQGNIYYVYRARVHERPDPQAARSGALIGSTSATLWGDLIPFEALPSVFNPPSGYLQNCNNSPWYVTDNPSFGRADVPLEVHAGDFLTVRGRLVLELIAASGNNFMMVMRLKPGESPQAWAMKPFGQSIDPNSPHYADLTALYSGDSLRKTWYDVSEFRAHAEQICAICEICSLFFCFCQNFEIPIQ